MRPSVRLGLTIDGCQEALKVVEGMRALLADEGSWCRATHATDARGSKVNVLDSAASCFCLVGALRRVASKSESLCADLAVHALYAELQLLHPWYPHAVTANEKVMYLEEFNDGQAEFDDVLNLLDKTVEDLCE